jgi:hypothetical protein
MKALRLALAEEKTRFNKKPKSKKWWVLMISKSDINKIKK